MVHNFLSAVVQDLVTSAVEEDKGRESVDSVALLEAGNACGVCVVDGEPGHRGVVAIKRGLISVDAHKHDFNCALILVCFGVEICESFIEEAARGSPVCAKVHADPFGTSSKRCNRAYGVFCLHDVLTEDRFQL